MNKNRARVSANRHVSQGRRDMIRARASANGHVSQGQRRSYGPPDDSNTDPPVPPDDSKTDPPVPPDDSKTDPPVPSGDSKTDPPVPPDDSKTDPPVPPDDSKPGPPHSRTYRVPYSIRKAKEGAYTPQIVSIGPFHCDKKKLKDMDKHKHRYVEEFYKRTNKKREDVLEIIKRHEQQIQNFYSETLNLEDHKHVRMILLDAIFILELLWRNFQGADDNLLRIPADKLALKLDLLLLENQLPYFLLKEIYDSTVSRPSFIEICSEFFRSLFFNSDVSGLNEFMHFTDMLRYTLVKDFQPEDRPEDNDSEPLPCATKLRESGVKFTRVRSGPLLEVKFEGGKLRMTRFSVHHQTETLLRNIMALEQCHYGGHTFVCDYVILLDDLIEDKRDAQLLVDAGIISNSLGDCKALANLFNKLSVEIRLIGFHYDNTYQKLKNYSNDKYNRSVAKLKSLYFGDIWKGTATIAASVLLILTFLQTIASLKQL